MPITDGRNMYRSESRVSRADSPSLADIVSLFFGWGAHEFQEAP